MPRFIDIDGSTPIAAAAEARTALGAERLAVFNALDYGAAGDGIADDKVAIQAAIDAAVSAGGGQVFLPAGTYKLTNKITLGDNVIFSGAGNGTVLAPAYASSSVNRVIDNDWVNGNSNIVLRDFKLDRSGANISHGILLNGIDNLLIDNISVVGVPPIYPSGAIAISGIGPTPDLVSKNVRVVNCYFENTTNFAVQPGFVDGCIIANNTAVDCFREVFACEPEAGAASKNVVIANNTCYTGNVIAGGSISGPIIITSLYGGTIDGVSIVGNSIRQRSGAATGNPGINVRGSGVTNVSITGNTVHGMDGVGLAIGVAGSPTVGVVISGNSITECGAGIGLSAVTHATITGNYIYGTGHAYGINEANGCADNLIAMNFLRDATPLGVQYNNGDVLIGNKFTDGDPGVTIGHAQTYSTRLYLDRYTIGNAALTYRRSGIDRWIVSNGGAESGSNTGSDLSFLARTDAGDAVGTALTLTRSNLRVATGGNLKVGSTLDLGHDSDTTIARTAAGAISVEGNPVGIKVAVPASASATGVVGQWAADASWFYVCTATNTWVRAALATW